MGLELDDLLLQFLDLGTKAILSSRDLFLVQGRNLFRLRHLSTPRGQRRHSAWAPEPYHACAPAATGTHGRSRTDNTYGLSVRPLPVGLRGHARSVSPLPVFSIVV